MSLPLHSRRNSSSSLHRVRPLSFLLFGASLCALGCDGSTKDGSGGGGTGSDGSGLPVIVTGGTGSGGGTGTATQTIPRPPEEAFVAGEFGAYALGEAQTAGTSGAVAVGTVGGCSGLIGTVRDFRGENEPGGHGDFEAFNGGGTKGLVQTQLATDRKPVFAGRCCDGGDNGDCPDGEQLTTEENFNQWYRSEEGVNLPYYAFFDFEKNGDVYTFSSNAFYPLDGAGFPSSREHNWGFTTELHTAFTYNGGEEFTFTGDDDVWVFVNGKLAIDLGGLHSSQSDTLVLDDEASNLGIEVGKVYSLDLFHAERHSNESNFRVDTTMVFEDCGTIVPDQPFD